MTDETIRAPMAATVVDVTVVAGEAVRAGQALVVLDAMKMEHELRAAADGVVAEVPVRPGEMVGEGDLLVRLMRSGSAPPPRAAPEARPPAGERADLHEARARHALTLDAARPDAIAKRHALGLRTARENLADLCDPGSFDEAGALAHAAQRARRSLDDLIRNTPADGLVAGTATVGGLPCAVLAYDATVLAGTQGLRNHQKTDRLLAIAHAQRLPVILFAEGGGGRPGDTDMPVVAGLHVGTFAAFARLNGRVPSIGIAAGRCFAGNAALLGCCDVVIATRGSTIGMGGPAMVEGGGLGAFTPEQIGPSEVLAPAGVIDVLVEDEAEAVEKAKRCLAMLRGGAAAFEAPDPARLRDALPDSRVRSHDMRAVFAHLFDTGSLLDLRPRFGAAVHTAFARLEGRAVGVLASNPAHLGGAIDADAADKAARFLQLCNAHGLPVVSLIDTPGFMVGPDAEARAQVRHASRLFIAGARLRVPLVAVVVRKAYGLGAMALAGGGLHEPVATLAWPSGEFGAMGIEGAVRLGHRKELEALPEGPQREALFEQLVTRQHAEGRALNMAATLEIDAVIDPADTRARLVRTLAAARLRELPADPAIDTW